METKLRKYRDTLSITGMGVIVFGVWMVIKFILSTVFMDDYLAKNGIVLSDRMSEIVYYVFITVLLAVSVALRVKVGSDAIKEGKGKKRGIFYIFVAAFIYVPASVYSLYTGFSDMSDVFDSVTGMFVELTSLITTLEMLVSAIRVKKLEKEMES